MEIRGSAVTFLSCVFAHHFAHSPENKKHKKREKRKKNDRETQATIEILEIPTFFSRFMDRSSQLYDW